MVQVGGDFETNCLDTNADTIHLAIQPIVGNLTFQHLSAIISGCIAIFAALVSLFLIIMHATHFSEPRKQKQWVSTSILGISTKEKFSTGLFA